MRIITDKIDKNELLNSNIVFDGPMIKSVVDIKREIMGIDSNMHADIEQLLLEDGSNQDDLWGINLYPEEGGEDFIEFDSMINIRPRQNNPSRDVLDPDTRTKIIEVVNKWIS